MLKYTIFNVSKISYQGLNERRTPVMADETVINENSTVSSEYLDNVNRVFISNVREAYFEDPEAVRRDVA